jgi:hypothetical protein
LILLLSVKNFRPAFSDSEKAAILARYGREKSLILAHTARPKIHIYRALKKQENMIHKQPQDRLRSV